MINYQQINQHIDKLIETINRFQNDKKIVFNDCIVEKCTNSICAKLVTNEHRNVVFEIINGTNGNYAQTKLRIWGGNQEVYWFKSADNENLDLNIGKCAELLSDALEKTYNTQQIQSNIGDGTQFNLTCADRNIQNISY